MIYVQDAGKGFVPFEYRVWTPCLNLPPDRTPKLQAFSETRLFNSQTHIGRLNPTPQERSEVPSTIKTWLDYEAKAKAGARKSSEEKWSSFRAICGQVFVLTGFLLALYALAGSHRYYVHSP